MPDKLTNQITSHNAQSTRARDQSVPAAAREQSRRLVSVGTGGARRARASENKPILLSIGYAACHWCHVMEHESFEDEATAALMNEQFVNIKVDREERPDLDGIYMQAVQAMTGHGGWPMTVFLTPDGVPFYGGTYFPKRRPTRHAVVHAHSARPCRTRIRSKPDDVARTAAIGPRDVRRRRRKKRAALVR